VQQDSFLQGGKMNKVAIALSLIVSVSLLPGCGGDSESSETSTPKPASNSTPNANDTPSTSTPTKPAANPFAAAKGKLVFTGTCVACHGEGGIGVENLGKDMTISEFIKSKTDDELLAFVKVGRPIYDPLSAGIADMPPKGGNPSLTDEDLKNVIAYIRTLQK
jgi:mono/diheme cytochrome c family protein